MTVDPSHFELERAVKTFEVEVLKIKKAEVKKFETLQQHVHWQPGGTCQSYDLWLAESQQ